MYGEALSAACAVVSSAVVLACVAIAGYRDESRPDGGVEYVCVYAVSDHRYDSRNCDFVLATAAVSLIYTFFLTCAIIVGACQTDRLGCLAAFLCPRSKSVAQRCILITSLILDAAFVVLWFASLGVQYEKGDFKDPAGSAAEKSLTSRQWHQAAAMFFSATAGCTCALSVYLKHRGLDWKFICGERRIEEGEVELSRQERRDILAFLSLAFALVCSLVVFPVSLEYNILPARPPNSTGEVFEGCVFTGDEDTCTLVRTTGAISFCLAVCCFAHQCAWRWWTVSAPATHEAGRALLATTVAELWFVTFGLTVNRWSQLTTKSISLLSEPEENAAIAVQACSLLAALFWLIAAVVWWRTLTKGQNRREKESMIEAQSRLVRSKSFKCGRRSFTCEKYTACWRYLDGLCKKNKRVGHALLFCERSAKHCFCTKCQHSDLDKDCYTQGGEHRAVPKGWCLFPVNTEMILYRSALILPDRGEEIANWPLAYHGTTRESVVSILFDGKLCKPGEESRYLQQPVMPRRGHYNDDFQAPQGMDYHQVFLTPSIKYARRYARDDMHYTDSKTGIEYDAARVALLVAVRPGRYKKQTETVGLSQREKENDPLFPASEAEWCVPSSEDVAICGVLVQLVADA